MKPIPSRTSDSWRTRPRGQVPFYPALVAAFPVLAVFSANSAIVPAAHLVRPLAVALGLALALQIAATLLWVPWRRLGRSAARGAASTAVVVAWVWLYEPIVRLLHGVLPMPNMLPLYASVGLAVAVLAGVWGPRPRVPNLIAAAVALVSIGNVALTVGRPEFAAPFSAATTPRARHDAKPLPPGPRPDIFLVVLDGFGRQDSIRRVIGADLGWFVDGLRERGFKVADRALSNYNQTELSVSSTLNMDLLKNLLPTSAIAAHDKRALGPLIGDSSVSRRLQASGYRPIAIGSGFDGLRLGRNEVPTSEQRGLTLFESVLLAKTPSAVSENVARSMFDRHRDRLLGVFHRLEEMAKPTAQPRFVFAHVLAPHPPFVFGSNGEHRRPRGSFGYWDESDYMTYVGTPDDYRAGYAEQAAFVAKKVLALVDAFLAANPDRPPIILIQADHGSKIGLDQNSLENTDLAEAFSILYAAYVPEDVPMPVPDDAMPVNTFRRLLTALGADDLPEIQAGVFYSTMPLPFEWTDVTAAVGRAEAVAVDVPGPEQDAG